MVLLRAVCEWRVEPSAANKLSTIVAKKTGLLAGESEIFRQGCKSEQRLFLNLKEPSVSVLPSFNMHDKRVS